MRGERTSCAGAISWAAAIPWPEATRRLEGPLRFCCPMRCEDPMACGGRGGSMDPGDSLGCGGVSPASGLRLGAARSPLGRHAGSAPTEDRPRCRATRQGLSASGA